jgi:hypothetical protein
MYNLIEVRPQIFHAEFESIQTMCEAFMRCQETYESPNPKFGNNRFTIKDFTDWYTNKYDSNYNEDWGGFNMPSSVLDFIFSNPILDENENDKIVREIYNLAKIKHYRFYLIASKSNENITLEHELAHAFYFIDENYRNKMNIQVRRLPFPVKKKIYLEFKRLGYAHHVYKDEAQAYLSTGYDDIIENLVFDNSKFKEIFYDRKIS